MIVPEKRCEFISNAKGVPSWKPQRRRPLLPSVQAASDLIILEVRKLTDTDAGRSGLDLLTFMRSHPRLCVTPVLVYTGYTLDENEQRVIRECRAYVFYKAEGLMPVVAHVAGLLGLSDRPMRQHGWRAATVVLWRRHKGRSNVLKQERGSRNL